MSRRIKGAPEEQAKRKALRQLEAVNYTPTAARLLYSILLAMRKDTPELRAARLRVFSEIANER